MEVMPMVLLSQLTQWLSVLEHTVHKHLTWSGCMAALPFLCLVVNHHFHWQIASTIVALIQWQCEIYHCQKYLELDIDRLENTFGLHSICFAIFWLPLGTLFCKCACRIVCENDFSSAL